MMDETPLDDRDAFTNNVAEGIAEMYPLKFYPLLNLAIGTNTSGCPIIRVDLGGGEIYNVTITRARK